MKCMGKVVLDISMSLDGFIAGLHDSPDNPMGDDGLRLHRWFGMDEDNHGTGVSAASPLCCCCHLSDG